MSKKMKNLLRLVPLIELGLVVLLSGISYILAKLWAGKYLRIEKSNSIIMRSLHEEVVDTLIRIMLYLIVVCCIVITVVCIVERVRHDADVGRLYAMTWIISGVCAAALFIGSVLVGSSSDTDPKCFEFTDNKHNIVIEEESWLLGGWGNIYQVYDDGSAKKLNSFSTDDGYRNNGSYEITWYDDHADITFTFDDYKNTRKTVAAKFE